MELLQQIVGWAFVGASVTLIVICGIAGFSRPEGDE